MFWLLLTTCLVALIIFCIMKVIEVQRVMADMPGPKGWPVLGILPEIRMDLAHKQLDAWSQKHGPVMRLHAFRKVGVIVSDFDSIYQLLVTNGKECGGRPYVVRPAMLLHNTGILFSTEPDQTWRALRKASHKHLKQFGEGMTYLEGVITDIAEDMFDTINDNIDKPFDPYQAIFDTALKSIAFLITGKRLDSDDPVLGKMRYFENNALQFTLSTKVKHFIYELMPSLKHLRLSGWRDIEYFLNLEADIWKDVQRFCAEDPEARSLVTNLMNHVLDQTKEDNFFSETDVRKTALSLVFAGVTTTSASFYAGVNLLAHNPSIQNKIHKEIAEVAGNTTVGLEHRPDMPYTHAVLLELLRYVSVVPAGIPHRTIQDTNICGYNIPKDTFLFTNLWTLHHDAEFWKDPFVFRPERFLDNKGKLVPADHPNRKHLMPFGAGTRVCLGESLALARLFLWLVTLVQRYKVVPADDNPKSATDPRLFKLEAVLRVTRYSVIFKSH